MNIQNLFPTPVGFFELPRSLTSSELSHIKNLDKVNNQKNLRTGDINILNHSELRSLSNFFNESLQDYFNKIYCPKNEIMPFITISWANYTGRNCSHPPHIHQNSFLSGVFYVEVNDFKDEIVFYRDPFVYDIPTENFNQYNSTKWYVPVKSGLLLIFPSNLMHSVEPIVEDRIRISISFNTFLKGSLGDKNDLDYLIL